MRSPARAMVAWAVVLVIVAPIIAQAWPVCVDEDMAGEMRCAGLWTADCCDYFVAKERIRGSDYGTARPLLALPASSDCCRYLGEPTYPERVPGARAPTAHPEQAVSSTVLRL